MTLRNHRLSTRATLTLVILVTAGALALVLMHASSAAAKARPTVKLARTSLGQILVSSSGMTLYAFTRDGHNTDKCMKVSGCASVWPLYTSTHKVLAGPGVRSSLLGSIKLPHRTARQITYAGHPLYTYSADSTPASTDYVGVPQFGGTWLAVSASGKTKR